MKISSSLGIRQACWAWALLFFSVMPGWCAALQAGIAETEITPPPGLPMWGYSNREGPATGTLDPLYARVLVLEVGSQRLALVTVDLGRPFGPASLDWLRSATHSDVSVIIVAASHTHSGPSIQDEYPNGTPAWETSALKKIAQAISEARAHLTDARIGIGYGFTLIGHNRLRVNRDGTVSWFERNETRIPTAPVDGTVTVLRVDTSAGQPLAILVNYACHPVIFGSDNLQYSADFPAAVAKTVEGAFESKPLSFFLQEAPGDINPYFAVTPLEEDAVSIRDRAGEMLGREVVRVAKEIHPQTENEPDLSFSEERVNVHLRWNPEKWAIMTMPGEPFVQYQLAWRERCPVRGALLVGYANGYDGYFPTIPSATLGGYGAANPATWVEIGAGDRMLDAAVISIQRMLGRLPDVPEDLRK